MRITAAVMEKADAVLARRKIELEDVELEGPREDEVLIRVTSCGVCGTDKGVIHGLEPFPTPGVLGHEGAGGVEEVGSRVTMVKPGDRVMIGVPYCGRCRTCRRGEPRYCQDDMGLTFSGYRLDGSSPMRRPGWEKLAGRFFQQSSWATYTLALDRQLAVVPEGLDVDLTGPYGCSISTRAGTVLNELKPYPGSSIAIFGTGGVGLAAIMAARMTGATRIIAVDEVPERLALAKELGATHAIEHGAGTVAELKEITKDQLDFAIEAAAGATPPVIPGPGSQRPGGREANRPTDFATRRVLLRPARAGG
ncbi:Aryl-alcohol dehydrogenase [Aquisphaera giovannonii]|uniref:Aryl-alcohol dehydrogenase n=1 Tax=Aquisphaera giovannonii TaxID=406548 RepID=A0A5B9WE84_9BACT|nr:alcohol dehydrogenase catalytic domain-containing protein [Aquisphaera giovannonii]QEH38539.1 Aryl-alcohol dehydrogenase [Aquisphaera giovannonii]